MNKFQNDINKAFKFNGEQNTKNVFKDSEYYGKYCKTKLKTFFLLTLRYGRDSI